MEDQFKYKLKIPISIDKEGKIEKADNLIVKAPLTTGDDEFALTIESEYKTCLKSMMSLYKDNKDFTSNVDQQEIEKAKENHSSVAELMLMSGNNLMTSFFNLKELLCKGNTEKPQCTIGGIKIKKPLFDKLCIADKKEILGRYINSFLS